MFDQTGANAILDIFAAAILDNDRGDALEVQNARLGQTSRSRSDNTDLRAHRFRSRLFLYHLGHPV
jgi:hypothetical protein